MKSSFDFKLGSILLLQHSFSLKSYASIHVYLVSRILTLGILIPRSMNSYVKYERIALKGNFNVVASPSMGRLPYGKFEMQRKSKARGEARISP